MIAVTARLTVKPGREADLEKTVRELAAAVDANEPGCELYQLSRSKADKSLYLLMERYADDAALATHSNSDHFKAAIPGLMDCCDGRPDIALFDEL